MGGEIPGVLSLPPTDAGLLRARPRKLAHACPLSVHQIRVRIPSFISAVIFVCVSLPAFISWLWQTWDITEFYHYRRSWLSLWPTAGILRHRVRLRTSRPDSELGDTTLAAGHEPWWEPVLMENSKRRFRGEPALRPRAAQRAVACLTFLCATVRVDTTPRFLQWIRGSSYAVLPSLLSSPVTR